MKKQDFFEIEKPADDMRHLKKSLNETRMTGFLFSDPESRLFEAVPPGKTLTGASSSKVGGLDDKKKIIRLVVDVERALSANDFKRTSALMSVAKKKLNAEMNSSDADSVNLFSLAPAALDAIRSICAAIELAEETTREVGREDKFRGNETVRAVGLDEDAVKKIINNGFKANPGFFKYLGSKLPFIGAIRSAIDNLKTKESAQHRGVDPFSRFPPLFEETTGDGLIYEVTGLEILGGGAAAGLAKAGYDYLKQLSQGGSVSGKGSVAAYMSLFGSSEGIHKALYADLVAARMMNVKAVSDAISKSETKHLGIKPTPPKATAVSGLISDPKDFSVESALSGSDGIDLDDARKFASSLRLGGKGDDGSLVIAWENEDAENKWKAFKENPGMAGSVKDNVLTPLLKKMTPPFMQMSGSNKNQSSVKSSIVDLINSGLGGGTVAMSLSGSSGEYVRAALEALDFVQLKWDPEEGYKLFTVPGKGQAYADALSKIAAQSSGSMNVDFYKKKILEPLAKEIKDPKNIFESRNFPDDREVIIERWQRLAGIIK